MRDVPNFKELVLSYAVLFIVSMGIVSAVCFAGASVIVVLPLTAGRYVFPELLGSLKAPEMFLIALLCSLLSGFLFALIQLIKSFFR